MPTLKLIAINVFFLFLFIEGALRIAGFAFDAQKFYLNRSSSDSNVLRILTLGESTTSDAAVRDGASWPRVLGEILKKNGITNAIYNEGKVATDSTFLMEGLPGFIEKYRPHLVITMMGVNDRRLWLTDNGLTVQEGIVASLRTVKLVKLGVGLLKDLWLEESENISISDLGFTDFEKVDEYARTSDLNSADRLIEVFLADKSPLEKSQFYAFLGRKYQPEWGLPRKAFELSFHFFGQSLKYSTQVSYALDTYSNIIANPPNENLCRELVKMLVEANREIPDSVLSRMSDCLPANDIELNKMMTLTKRDVVVKTGSPLRENYRFARRFLNQKNICFIAMQYPTEDTKTLTDYFADQESSDRFQIVSNKENFQKALKKHSYPELFYDNFGVTFGHTTGLGHRLIAEQVSKTVLDFARSRKCKF